MCDSFDKKITKPALNDGFPLLAAVNISIFLGVSKN